MNDTGYKQGYYIAVFLKFLWHFAVMLIVHSITLYIFGYNTFTYYILLIVFSFLVNSSLPMGENYPFIRHGLIFVAFLFAQSYLYEFTLGKAYGFFVPTPLWSWLMIISMMIGIMSSIGRYGRGTHSHHLENFSNFFLLIILILAFVLYWWQGGLMYLILRVPMMIAEISIANSILYYMMYSRSDNDQSQNIS